MATTVLGSIGAKINLLIKQGSTFELSGTLRNPDLTPVDLTLPAELRAKIRKKALDVAVVATFVFTYPARPLGQWVATLTDEITAAIVTGEYLTSKESQFVWDMELEDAAGRVIPIFYGDVQIYREVTRT